MMQWKRMVLIMLINLISLITSVNIFGQIRPNQDSKPITQQTLSEDQVRDMYFSSGQNSDKPRAGLRVRVYQKNEDCEYIPVSAYKTFMSKQSLRFAIESNIDGHLYIMQRGSSGKIQVLFPQPEINSGNNFLKRGMEVMLPGKGAFTFDNTPGVENLMFILTKKDASILQYISSNNGSIQELSANATIETEVLSILQGKKEARDMVYTNSKTPFQVVTQSVVIYGAIYAVNTNTSMDSICVLQINLQHK